MSSKGPIFRKLFPVLILAVIMVFLIRPSTGGFFFKDGDDPVVFIGDSVTQEGLYPVLVETFLLTRFPDWKLSFRNLGLNGDTSWLRRRGGLKSLIERDLPALRPKAVTVNFGLNDSGGPVEESLPMFSQSMSALVDALKTSGARVAVLTASPMEGVHPDAPGGSERNFQLNKFVLEAEAVASRAGVPNVDLFTPFLRAIEATQVSDTGLQIVPDGLHPGPEGHWLFAAKLLLNLGAPALVSHAAIDFAERRVTAGEGCSVEINRDSPPGELVFKRIDAALPWPVPEECHPAMNLPGFDPLGDLSRFTLQVTGLPDGEYEVLIDGESAGVFHSLQLAEGHNFSLAPGPVLDQCRELLDLVREKNALSIRWNKDVRLYRPPSWFIGHDRKDLPPEEAAAMTLLDKKRAIEAERVEAEIRALESRIEPLRKPKLHSWRIAPVADKDQKIELKGGASTVFPWFTASSIRRMGRSGCTTSPLLPSGRLQARPSKPKGSSATSPSSTAPRKKPSNSAPHSPTRDVSHCSGSSRPLWPTNSASPLAPSCATLRPPRSSFPRATPTSKKSGKTSPTSNATTAGQAT